MSERNTAIVYKLQRCNLFTGAVLRSCVALEYVFSAIFRGSFGPFHPRVYFPLAPGIIPTVYTRDIVPAE